MALVLDPQEPAICRGIKTVGIGKKGSRSLTLELAREIVQDLNHGKVSPAAQGAFFAGLIAKGIEPQEEILGQAFSPGVWKDPYRLIKALAPEAPEFALWICGQLAEGRTLDKHTAYDLGRFLYSDQPGDAARGWIASFLRVRYETDDEYEGLWQAMQETVDPAFKFSAPPGGPILQIAEPFDGVDHSMMITPLIGHFFQQSGYRVVHQTGKNSGPKSEMNLWDVARHLGVQPVRSNQELAEPKPRFGWFFHQSLMSSSLDEWVGLRRQIIKRPFLATIERFINPLQADFFIASAFHPPYGEKMLTLAERSGFKNTIIVRNGIEGTLAFPLMREVRLLLSCRQQDGSFKRHEMVIDHPPAVEAEEMVAKPSPQVNAGLIEAHYATGFSGNTHFDARVARTCAGLKEALAWFHYQ